jgi:hypothetical protein
MAPQMVSPGSRVQARGLPKSAKTLGKDGCWTHSSSHQPMEHKLTQAPVVPRWAFIATALQILDGPVLRIPAGLNCLFAALLALFCSDF